MCCTVVINYKSTKIVLYFELLSNVFIWSYSRKSKRMSKHFLSRYLIVRLSLMSGYLFSSACNSSNVISPLPSSSASLKSALVSSSISSSLNFRELSSIQDNSTVFSSSKSIVLLPVRVLKIRTSTKNKKCLLNLGNRVHGQHSATINEMLTCNF